jgi:hypothetical protein
MTTEVEGGVIVSVRRVLGEVETAKTLGRRAQGLKKPPSATRHLSSPPRRITSDCVGGNGRRQQDQGEKSDEHSLLLTAAVLRISYSRLMYGSKSLR